MSDKTDERQLGYDDTTWDGLREAVDEALALDQELNYDAQKRRLREPQPMKVDPRNVDYLLQHFERDEAADSASPAVAIVRRVTADILGEVAIERVRQDEKWGGPDHDDEHDATDWCRYIEMRLHSSNAGHTTGDSRRWFLEIAALAVAAIETIDRADNNEDGA